MSVGRLPRRLTRAYWTCHFLRWLPLGLVLPVMALLPADRGLSVAEIGVVFGVYAAVAAVLELPTGNLADVLGRKPVLIAAALFEAVWYGGYLIADSVVLFAVALALGGVGRALASGALEAWYVDQVYATSPGADVRPGLGGAMFLTNMAVFTGAVAAAGTPLLGVDLSWVDSVSVLPVAAALLCGTGYLVAVAALVTESRPHAGVRGALRELRRQPRVMRDVMRAAAGAGRIRLLLIAGAAVGLGMGSVEAFWQPQFASVLDDPQRATSVFGLLVGASTLVGGVASIVAAGLPARVTRRPDLICAGLVASLGASIVLLAVAPTFAIAAAAFLVVYFFLELRAPLAQAMLHQAAPSGLRASVLSAYAMSTSIGAAVAAVGLGALAATWGVEAIWTIAGALVIAGASTYLRLPRFPLPRPATKPDAAVMPQTPAARS
ncbi:MAG: MFS transporter [Micromonosporaceae bacterium]